MLARGFQTYGTLSTAWSRSRWGPGALGFGLRLRLGFRLWGDLNHFDDFDNLNWLGLRFRFRLRLRLGLRFRLGFLLIFTRKILIEKQVVELV